MAAVKRSVSGYGPAVHRAAVCAEGVGRGWLLLTGLLALLVNIESLAELVSIGTLFVFFCVCAGCLRRRYYEPGRSAPGPLILRCAIMTLFNLGAPQFTAPNE